MNQEYMNSNLTGENKMLRDRITELEDEIYEMKENNMKKGVKNMMSYEEKEIKVNNRNLRERLEFLQRR
jgi:regulator of replication initiation timing